MSGTHHLYTITGRALPNPPRRTPSRHSDILRLPTHRYDPTVDGSEGSMHRGRRIETPHGGEFHFISEAQRKASQLVPYAANEVNKSNMKDKAAEETTNGSAKQSNGQRGRKAPTAATAASSTASKSHKPRGRQGRKHSHRGHELHIAAPRLGQVPYADLSFTATSEPSSRSSMATPAAAAAAAVVMSSGTKKRMMPYAPSSYMSERSSIDQSLYAESTHMSGVVNGAKTKNMSNGVAKAEAQLPAPTPHLQASQPRRSSPQPSSVTAGKAVLEEPMRATELVYKAASRPRETLQQKSPLHQSPAAPPLFGLRPPSTLMQPGDAATPNSQGEQLHESDEEKEAEVVVSERKAMRGVSTAQVTSVTSTHESEAEKKASRAHTRSELASYLMQPHETWSANESAAEAARLAKAHAADSQFRRSPQKDTSYRPVLSSPASHGDRGVSPRRGSCSPGREPELTHEALVERIRRLSCSPRRSTSNSVGGTELLPPRPYLQGMQQVTDNRVRFTIVRFIENQPETRRAELYSMLKEYEGRETELCDALTDAFGEEFMEQKMLLAAV